MTQRRLAPELEVEIKAMFTDVLKEHSADKNKKVPEIVPDMVLLEAGLDSLGFAILVSELEMKLGYDPFTISEEAVYPTTYQEFVQFYVDNQP